MKRLISFAAAILLVFTMVAVSANEIVTVFVNGNEVISDTPAVIVDDSTTMLPFRAILNSLGISDSQITWDEGSQSIEIKDGDNFIFIAVGQSAAIVNNVLINLNVLPYIENGRTMVPVRFISESLGASVEWDEVGKSVHINNTNSN